MIKNELIISGARVHNLQNVSLTIPKNKLVVFTGLSGSGKSSLAFDTIYAEGQRRYVESLSAYARQFLQQLEKPDVDSIDGLSPAISIDQKSASHNPRSTVGTITEIYDYLRLLFASIGKPFCPKCGREIQRQSVEEIVTYLLTWPEETKILIIAPLLQGKKGEHANIIENIKKDGFSRFRLDGEIYHVTDPVKIEKTKKHTLEIIIDRLSINAENKRRIFESVETALKQTGGLVVVENLDTTGKKLFSEHLTCPICQESIAEISPRIFSFNSPFGACDTCKGLGDLYDFDPSLVIEDINLPARLATQKCLNLNNTYYGHSAGQLARKYGFTLDIPIAKLTAEQLEVFLYGEESFGNDKMWEGVITNLKRRYYQTDSESMRYFFRSFMSTKKCPDCHGKRLNTQALSVKIQGKNITEITCQSTENLANFFANLKLTDKEKDISRQILKEINERLSFLVHVGLTYITLDRKASTLSGGEFQRIRLATQIGVGLSGVLYVLDEPSIGLHQKDNAKLIETLLRLRDIGNTVIVVEHDEETIRSADYIVDIGPGAGTSGGKIVFAGTAPQLLASKNSLTADYLNGKKSIPVPQKRRAYKQEKYLKIIGATENNLKNIDVFFPLGKFICVTGVSGSGKSSLISDILYSALSKHFNRSKIQVGKHTRIEGLENIDKVITIDQSAIGRTPRSNPATYTQLFGPLRELFVQTREARVRGYKAGRFSFNVKGGRCEACEGDGVIKIEMHFLNDVYVTCDVCKGKRYNAETLEVKYKGYNISDVLDMTVQQAVDLFVNIPSIMQKLQTLIDVGLGYIHLGQSATTLSGGEAQRIKLAKELSKRSTGNTLYLLDEPTTGLHFADIQKLLDVLNRLVNSKNTVLVVEHNLDVVKVADYIIDLGPEGGDKGGHIVASGTPEDIAKNKKSFTGQFLSKILK